MKIDRRVPPIRFPEFHDEWAATTLGAIATFLKGRNISKEDIVGNGKFEAIRYGELYTLYGETITEVKSKTNLPTSSLVFSKANDVIIPASGETHIDIAIASCVLKNGVALSGDINIIRTDNNGVFLAYYLSHAKKVDIARLAQGVSVVHLYSSNLKNLTLQLPGKNEQSKIAMFLNALDQKVAVIHMKVELLQQYKKGIMQQIFGQKIRFCDEKGQLYPVWTNKKTNEVFNCLKGQGLSRDDVVPKGLNECVLYGELYTTYAETIEDVKSRTNSKEGTLSKLGDL